MICNCHSWQAYLTYISQHRTNCAQLKTGVPAKTNTQQCKQTCYTVTFLCTCTHLHTRNISEMSEDLVGNYDSHRESNAGRPVTWKAVLEQLCNRITRCLNRPLRDALSFPAGKADQSQLSSPWSRRRNRDVGGLVRDRVKGETSGEMTGFGGLF